MVRRGWSVGRASEELAPAARAMTIERVVSPGGIEAWLVRDRTVPLIALEFAMRGSADQDPPGLPGVAELATSLLDEPAFIFPMAGSLLGLLGGLTVFFRGPGGALIAIAGGVSVAGFALNIDQTVELDHFWDNQLAVGVVMLMLAAMAGSMSRANRRPTHWDDEDSSPNRRTF